MQKKQIHSERRATNRIGTTSGSPVRDKRAKGGESREELLVALWDRAGVEEERGGQRDRSGRLKEARREGGYE